MTNHRPMVAPHMLSLDEQKAAARAQALSRRMGLDATEAGLALTAHFLHDVTLPSRCCVSGFWPLAQEIDIRPLLAALHDRGHLIALPVTGKRGQALTFRQWTPGAALVKERFGTMRPDGPQVTPDAILVPLLAFDATCHRLGYGGGFYDRTLAAMPGKPKIGCAFAEQQVDAVPVGPYDIRLDAVVTDRGVLRYEGSDAHIVPG